MADAWFPAAHLFRHPREALDWLRWPASVEEEPYPAPGPAPRAPLTDDDGLPAIITRAQDDLRSQQALARMGYVQVRAEYSQHLKAGSDTFLPLEDDQLWPSMEFVRDWLRAEKIRLLGQAGWTFVGAMAVTVVAGATFAIVLAALG